MSMRFPAGLRPAKRGELALAMSLGVTVLRRSSPLAAAALFPILLAGCGETPGDFSGDRAYKPLSPQLLALMQEKGTTTDAPVLIRAFKKEAEVEIWKMKADGHYTLLKTYPICRWSGQLGPKKREGDRQVPEGFYTITRAQMNPRSNYYLSFNVGYPNAYDRAHGYTGGEIMVHGVCSSAGCFSMTDQQIAEIYAIAREAFAGGQRVIQMQSYPFHMTPENFAKYRLDPNIAFWKELKIGDDNFEVTKKDVAVGVCNEHYVFDAEPADGSAFDPTGPCPALKRDKDVALEVAAKEKSDESKVAELVAEGVRPVRTVYADGGQNPQFTPRWNFAHWNDVSRPEALAEGPVNIPLDQSRKYKAPTLAQLEAAKAKAQAAAAIAERKAAAAHAFAYVDPAEAGSGRSAQGQTGFALTLPKFGQAATPAPAQAAAPAPSAPQGAPQAAPSGFNIAGFGHFFGGQPAQPAPSVVAETAEAPHPADVPLPPLRMEARAVMPQTSSRSERPRVEPPKPIQTAAVRAKPSGAKAKQAKTSQGNSGQAGSEQAQSAEAAAEEAKAAYAQPIAGSTSFLPLGFSAFAASDH